MSNIIRNAALILICTILFQLTGCGLVVINYEKFGNGDETDTSMNAVSDTAPVTETEITVESIKRDYTDEVNGYLSQIPETDYTDSVFKIVSPDISSLSGSEEVEFLSKTAETRNNIVERRHSISIVSAKVDLTMLYEEVNAAVKSGMYYSDLLMLPQELIGSFAASGLLLNMRSMPGLDFDAEYFNQSSVGAAAGGFNSYAIAGYASVYPYSLPAVFFNKELCASTGIDPYSLVVSGEWMWDKFFEIGINAAEMEYIFSWGTTDLGDAVYESAFLSSGYKMVNSGIMKLPSLAFDAESSVGAVDVLKQLYSDESSIHTNSDALSLFADGKGFFQIEKLSAMTTLRDSKISWGILPLPKRNAASSYISLAGSDSLMFACPATVSTPDKSAVILMSLNAASVGTIRDAYIEYIQYNFLRDNESANMLEYIIDGTTYDFAYTFGGMYSGIADGTYELIRQVALPDESMEGLLGNRKNGADRVFASRFGLSN